MKRALSSIFCVLTICAVICVNGCGKKDADGAKSDKGGDAAQADGKEDKK